MVTNLFGHGQSLGIRDWVEFLLLQLFNGVFVISQIQLGANQNDGSVGTMVSHLRVPLQTQTQHLQVSQMQNFEQCCVCHSEHQYLAYDADQTLTKKKQRFNLSVAQDLILLDLTRSIIRLLEQDPKHTYTYIQYVYSL